MSDPNPEPDPLPPLPGRAPLPDPPKLEYRRPVAEKDRLGKLATHAGNEARGLSLGMSIATSLIGSIFGGAIVGWLLDTYVIRSSTPWGMIVFVLLGCVSGFANMIRISNQSNNDGGGKS